MSDELWSVGGWGFDQDGFFNMQIEWVCRHNMFMDQHKCVKL